MKKCLCWLLCTVLLCSVGVSLAACAENPGSSSTLAAASATSEAGSASGVASSRPAASASLEPEEPAETEEVLLPASIISPVVALRRPQSYPAAALVTYESTSYSSNGFSYGNDEQGWAEMMVPSSIGDIDNHFVSDQIVALVQTKKRLVHVSTDGGENWQQHALPEMENLAPDLCSIAFSSKTEGVLVYGQHLPYAPTPYTYENGFHAFVLAAFSTKDGGQSWQHMGTTAFSYDAEPRYGWEHIPFNIAFADASTGWIAFKDPLQNNVTLYETFDGGARWSPARIQYTEHMQPGTKNKPVRLPSYKNGKWVCTVGEGFYGRKPFSVPAGQYTVTPAKDGQSWVWDDPGWDLPAGINPIEFMDNTQFALAPELHAPDEIDELDRQVKLNFWHASDTLRYIGREVEVLEYGRGLRHPVEDVVEMMEALYGYKDFDISRLGQYEEGNDYVDYFYPEHGLSYMDFKVLQVSTRANGIIEAVWEYKIETTDSPDHPDAERVYLRRLYRPVTVDGVQLFTLLSSEEIEKPV